MTDKIHDGKKVYEIGYLLISSVPKEKVADVAASIKGVLSKKGANFIGEEAPELISLAYTMIKKIGTSNHRFNDAYFGWMKFELAAGDIEEAKKTFDLMPEMLRLLVITTVRENTYLGKKAPAAPTLTAENVADVSAEIQGTESPADAKVAGSVEEMDKSIDEMVKTA